MPDVRASAPTRWLAFVVVVAAVTSIGLPLLGVRVFHGADMVVDRVPWRTAPGEESRAENPLVGDTVEFFMPMHAEFRRRLFRGDFPLWTPTVLGGLPLAAVADTGTSAPLNLPYLVTPLWYAPGLAKLIELLLAATFTALFLRRIGLGAAAGLTGGLVYAFTGFQVVWTNWPQSHVGALIPALFWAAERCVSDRRLLDGVLVAVVLAAMLLEGFPSVTGYALLAVGAYVAVRALSERDRSVSWRLSGGGIALAGVVFGFALAAFQLLTVADRVPTLDLAYREQSASGALPIEALVTTVVPNAFGSPVDRTWAGPHNYVELQSFIGAAALVLVMVALAGRSTRLSRGVVATLWAGVGLCTILAFVGGPLLEVAQTSDLFRLNAVGRLRSVWGFLLACLAGVGMHVVLREGRATFRRTAATVLGVGLVMVGAYLAYGQARDVGLGGYVAPRALWAGTAGILAGGLALHPRGRRIALVGIPSLIAVEALLFAVPFWPRVMPDDFYPATEAHRFLEANLQHERFVGGDGALFAGTASFYGLRSLTGTNTLPQPEPWEDLLRAVDPLAYSTSPVTPVYGAGLETATSAVLDRLAVRYFAVPPDNPILGRAVPSRGGSLEIALGAGNPVQAPIPPSEIRAVVIQTTAFRDLPAGARVRATLMSSGASVGSGSRRLFATGPIGRFEIAVAGCCSAPPTQVQLELIGRTGTVLMRGGRGDDPAIGLVEAADDGLDVAFAGDVVIYRRSTALPRIRWAARAVVEPDPEDRLRRLAFPLPPDTVVLSRPGPRADGLPADIRVHEDSGDVIAASVRSSGAGYLVVADPVQHGWLARLDGRPVPILAAEHGAGAIAVPPGDHRVTLIYEPDGWRLGRWVSLGAVFLLAAVVLMELRRRRSARGRGVAGRIPGDE